MKRKAKILFIHKTAATEYKLLLGRRISSNESFWWIPGGSVEAGESDFEAGLRELDEELFLTNDFVQVLNTFKSTGTTPAVIEYESKQAKNSIFLVPMIYPSLIAVPSIKDEFEEMAWFDLDNLPQNMSREFYFIEQQLQTEIRQL